MRSTKQFQAGSVASSRSNTARTTSSGETSRAAIRAARSRPLSSVNSVDIWFSSGVGRRGAAPGAVGARRALAIRYGGVEGQRRAHLAERELVEVRHRLGLTLDRGQ